MKILNKADAILPSEIYKKELSKTTTKLFSMLFSFTFYKHFSFTSLNVLIYLWDRSVVYSTRNVLLTFCNGHLCIFMEIVTERLLCIIV